jgi:hypothetical protein
MGAQGLTYSPAIAQQHRGFGVCNRPKRSRQSMKM